MKRILILTVTAGNAHNACALGMKKKLASLGGAEVKIVDLLKTFSGRTNAWVADSGYAISVRNFLDLYNAFYRYYRKADPSKRYACPSQVTVLSVVGGLMEEILSFRLDAIYCTHFYGAIALTDLKLVYALPCKTVASCLDYVNSPFWEAGIGVDYLSVPGCDFIGEFVAEGFREEQILPMGLPVDERTLERADKAEARRKIGLKEDVFTVMVMFGGGYWGGGFAIFKSLLKAVSGRKVQIIMINGKNERDFKKIEKMNFEEGIDVVNVGFTDNVPLYLSAADVILSKGGGASVTETVNASVPMIAPERMAAQEQSNVEYMKRKGVALSFKNEKELKGLLSTLMDDPNILRQMSEKTYFLRKNAINDLAHFMLSLPDADYTGLEREKIDLSEVKRTVAAAVKNANRAMQIRRKDAKNR